MQNNEHNPLSPEPQVIVEPIQRTNPIVEQALDEIKETIAADGYCSIPEYLELRDRFQLTDEVLLPIIQQAGYGFVKTSAVNPDLPQEVIVDLRYIAAVMLLAYGERDFAHHTSVLECVKTLYRVGNWEGSLCVSDELLEDIYSTYGHHFTYGVIAENAKLDTDDRSLTGVERFVSRHVHALNELGRNDVELTAVYHLCLTVMLLVNNGQAAAPLYRNCHGEVQAYNYFWKTACKIKDTARAKEK